MITTFLVIKTKPTAKMFLSVTLILFTDTYAIQRCTNLYICNAIVSLSVLWDAILKSGAGKLCSPWIQSYADNNSKWQVLWLKVIKLQVFFSEVKSKWRLLSPQKTTHVVKKYCRLTIMVGPAMLRAKLAFFRLCESNNAWLWRSILNHHNGAHNPCVWPQNAWKRCVIYQDNNA